MRADLTPTIRHLIESQRREPGKAGAQIGALRVSYERGALSRDTLVIGRLDREPNEEEVADVRAAIPADWTVAVTEFMPLIKRVRFTIYVTRCGCGRDLDDNAKLFGDGETCSSCLAQRRAGRVPHHA